MKNILYLFLMLLAIGGGVGYYFWDKPYSNLGTPDIYVTAMELSKDFTENENKASEKYIGKNGQMKVVCLVGTILGITHDSKEIGLSLDTGSSSSGVICILDKQAKQPKIAYKIGEKVMLKGLIKDKLTNVILDRCVPTE
jgi:tRNA_anti-like